MAGELMEDVKRGSDHLRGELASELAADSEAFVAEGSEVLLKFHGIYQQDDRDVRRERASKKLPLAYSCMVRTAVPGGELTAEQWLALDRLAELADGTMRLTTRQGVQFHFVHKGSLHQARQRHQRCGDDDVGRLWRCRAQHHGLPLAGRPPSRAPPARGRAGRPLPAAHRRLLGAVGRRRQGRHRGTERSRSAVGTPRSRSTAPSTCPASSRSPWPGRATTVSTCSPTTSASCPTLESERCPGITVDRRGHRLRRLRRRRPRTEPRPPGRHLSPPGVAAGVDRPGAGRRRRRGDRHRPARLRQP